MPGGIGVAVGKSPGAFAVAGTGVGTGVAPGAGSAVGVGPGTGPPGTADAPDAGDERLPGAEDALGVPDKGGCVGVEAPGPDVDTGATERGGRSPESPGNAPPPPLHADRLAPNVSNANGDIVRRRSVCPFTCIFFLSRGIQGATSRGTKSFRKSPPIVKISSDTPPDFREAIGRGYNIPRLGDGPQWFVSVTSMNKVHK